MDIHHLPYGSHTVGSLLLERAEATPDASFLRLENEFGVEEFDYADVVTLARAGASALRTAGVGKGDVVGLALPNGRGFFACWFGAALLGAIIAPMNPRGTVEEFAHMIRHSSSAAVVCERQAAERIQAATAGHGVEIITAGDDFEDRSVTSDRVVSIPADLSPTETAAILYTSGTSSAPKGVVVTHANYLHAGSVVAQHLRMRPDDRWLVVLPLFHANAQYYCTMSSLVTGASLAVTHRFSASNWPAQVRRHDATLASLFAAPARMILRNARGDSDAHNRLRATIFGQNLSPAELVEFESRFDCPLLQIYGMTETMAPPLLNPLVGLRDSTTIGRPVATRIRIVGEDGAEVAAGEIGELLVHGVPGVSLMSHYLDDADATNAVLNDGWLRTGDLVRARDDGFVVFADRLRDIIKRSGENVSAAEIERVVDEHGDVLESAAVAIPDGLRDEAVKLVVVVREGHTLTADELLRYCRQRLAQYKVPSVVEFVEALPRTSVGKIQKSALRGTGGTRR
ncbi:AMP-binding protein [Nocardia sp. NBC_00508]|uniref:class I adenylate-forming enzyme family protein n=1 Tax=Nocardia sp. NBC_00508 TaxID=2975992 RepID=UPI002E8066E8|nr:AMP-binding protein [Nocardia sp. NBC_00508]WUD64716.1 AMP-binding protein [Nocardia sp. NBC_00508]